MLILSLTPYLIKKYSHGIIRIWLRLGKVGSKYIAAIREGDKGNIEPLIEFARN